MSSTITVQPPFVLPRHRYIGLKQPNTEVVDILCGEARRVVVDPGTLISLTNTDGGAPALITSLDEDSAAFSISSSDSSS